MCLPDLGLVELLSLVLAVSSSSCLSGPDELLRLCTHFSIVSCLRIKVNKKYSCLFEIYATARKARECRWHDAKSGSSFAG